MPSGYTSGRNIPSTRPSSRKPSTCLRLKGELAVCLFQQCLPQHAPHLARLSLHHWTANNKTLTSSKPMGSTPTTTIAAAATLLVPVRSQRACLTPYTGAILPPTLAELVRLLSDKCVATVRDTQRKATAGPVRGPLSVFPVAYGWSWTNGWRWTYTWQATSAVQAVTSPAIYPDTKVPLDGLNNL